MPRWPLPRPRGVTSLRDEHHMRLDTLADRLTHTRARMDVFHLLFRRTIGEALAHLRHLERTGRARREVRDCVWWFAAG